MRSGIPYITIDSTLSGGLLAGVALNVLVQSLLEKLDYHCYLKSLHSSTKQDNLQLEDLENSDRKFLK